MSFPLTVLDKEANGYEFLHKNKLSIKGWLKQQSR